METLNSGKWKIKQRSLILCSAMLFFCCCTDSDAAENSNIELGSSVIDVLYTGNPPQSIKEAVIRVFFPKDKCLVVERIERIYKCVESEEVK